MNGDRRERQWRLEAAAALARLPPSRIRRYVRLGLVRPAGYEGRVALFGDAELARLRRLRRLSEDLGLNTAGVAVTIRLLDEIVRLQAQLRRSGRSRDA